MDEKTVIEAMAERMQQAAEGVMEARESFQRLGVAVMDASGNMREASDVFEEVAEALRRIEPEYPRPWESSCLDRWGPLIFELYKRRISPKRRTWSAGLRIEADGRAPYVWSMQAEAGVPGSMREALLLAVPEEHHAMVDIEETGAADVLADVLLARSPFAAQEPQSTPTNNPSH